ncbi:MAG: glutamate-1-semialdehyde 2,1-aminomutase [Peptoniphilaceae bacterium]|nr:glutamate-1-semialdehyde 2,1-aminomutase [Peptoniphilaceae bacterium]MDY3738558.1 glutamate-1-semialdehyde 2,1-aminomutase [Peptoniphilaceae bacterium]
MNLFTRAKKVIPGGVNSPVRAFGSVNMDPIFIKKAKGPFLYDVNSNKYIDYINSWGPVILGHGKKDLIEKAKKYLEDGITFGLATEEEVKLAQLITNATNTDMIRFVNSGTEATMSAIRLARGFTKRNKILKFEGCYHGHSDSLLVKSGSGALTFNSPTSEGVSRETIMHTIVARYNDINDVKEKIEEYKNDIACVIIEPVAANMGVVVPDESFIKDLRKITEENKILLIFDEVITGFRIRFGSVDKLFNVKADLYCFGKIIGGGLPVGAFAGRREIMQKLTPLGGVYQAGTLSGNPLAMKMGYDVLTYLKDHQEIYDKLDKNAEKLALGFEKNIKELGINAKVSKFHSILSLFFGIDSEIKSYDDVKNADNNMFEKYFKSMLKSGFMFAPSQYEAIFLSDAIDDSIIEETIRKNREALKSIN